MRLVETLTLDPDTPVIGEFARLNFDAAYADIFRKLDIPLALPGTIGTNPDIDDDYIAREAILNVRRGAELIKLGRPDRALVILDRAVRELPDNFHAQYFRGEALVKVNRHEDALVAFNRAINFNPNDLDALCGQGFALASLGRTDEALNTFNRAVELKPNAILPLHWRAWGLFRRGRFEDALAEINRALEIEQIDPDLLYFKIAMLGKLRRWEEGVLVCNLAITVMEHINPFDMRIAWTYGARAAAFWELGDRDHAREDASHAIRLKVDIAPLHFIIGRSLTSLEPNPEHDTRALAAFDRCIELEPQYAEAHHQRAALLIKIKRYELALAASNRAVEFDPENVQYRELQTVLSRVIAFRKDVSIDPKRISAYNPQTLELIEPNQKPSKAEKADIIGKKDEGLMQEPRNRHDAATEAPHVVTAPARTETTARAEQRLSEAERAEFLAFAIANPWDSKSGVAPSAHIKITFAKWLGRGLGRTDIVKAQPNLASAYAAEVSRNPSKRVEGLAVRPHKLPPDAPRPLSMYRVAELTPDEIGTKRADERERKRRSREKLKTHTLG